MSTHHDGQRRLQDRLETRRIADRLEQRTYAGALDDGDRDLIEKSDHVLLATADALPARDRRP